MHGLARDALRARRRKSGAERAGLHARASQWLAGRGMLDEAARHALAAGSARRLRLAERGLYAAMMRHGHVGAVLDWLARLPTRELDRRPRLLLAAAWALAVSGRHREAEDLVGRILAHAGEDPAVRCECALILSGAAGSPTIPTASPSCTIRGRVAAAGRSNAAARAREPPRSARSSTGDPAARGCCQQQAPRGDFGGGFAHLARWAIRHRAHVPVGRQVRLTENLVRPALAAAEGELGRRDPMVSMLAALLAAAVWEQDRPQDAVALLANRLDVLERAGLPDACCWAIAPRRASPRRRGGASRARAARGAARPRTARKLPRLAIASLAEQVRLHARRYRAETCPALCERIDAVFARADVPQGPLWQRSAEVLRQRRAPSPRSPRSDGGLVAAARGRATRRVDGPRRVRIELMALRAFALDRDGERARASAAGGDRPRQTSASRGCSSTRIRRSANGRRASATSSAEARSGRRARAPSPRRARGSPLPRRRPRAWR